MTTTNETESTASTIADQTQTTAPAQTAPAQTAPDLSIGDLKNLATIIDVASTRGAFRANEMATVGVMYNKLQAFLAKVTPAPAATAEAKPEDNKTAEAPATAGK
jgi:hypothetical protein